MQVARHGCLYTTHPVNDAVPTSDPLQPCPTRRRPWLGPTGWYAGDTDRGWWWGTGRPQQTGMGLSAAIAGPECCHRRQTGHCTATVSIAGSRAGTHPDRTHRRAVRVPPRPRREEPELPSPPDLIQMPRPECHRQSRGVTDSVRKSRLTSP